MFLQTAAGRLQVSPGASDGDLPGYFGIWCLKQERIPQSLMRVLRRGGKKTVMSPDFREGTLPIPFIPYKIRPISARDLRT